LSINDNEIKKWAHWKPTSFLLCRLVLYLKYSDEIKRIKIVGAWRINARCDIRMLWNL
jgi:hypothetical protein